MVISTKDTGHLKKISELIPNIKDADCNAKEFIVWYIKNFNENTFRVWIETDEEEKEVTSFVVAQVVKPLIEDEIFIPLSYISPDSKDAGKELLGRVEAWATSKGVRKISIYTKRSVEAYKKKYGFEYEFTSLCKKLNY